MSTSLLMNKGDKRITRNVLLLLVLILIQGALLAQDISVKSFRLLADDLTARVDPVTNDNGQTCALVKIVTTERGFSFEPDALGMCGPVDESQKGEVWIWISPGSRRLTIKHDNLGVLRGYEYPVDIESACTYEMVLVTGQVITTVVEQNRSNYLALTVSPSEAAVKIDGSLVVINQGQLSKRYPVGQYRYEVFCDLYHPQSGTFEIKPDQKTMLNVSLKPNYGFLKVASTPESGAAVFINGRNVGTTPYTSERLQSGNYTVQVAKDMYKDATKQVTVNDDLTTEVTLALAPDFAEPTITCADREAEIWINEEKKGTGRWSGRLPVGPYRVEARKSSHRTTTRQLTLEAGDNRTVTLDAPIPITGKIDVNSSPFGADIILDGKKVGTTPEILVQVLVGTHELRIEKAGCTSASRTVSVEEGKTAEVTVELATVRTVTLKSDPIGARLYIDDQYVGLSPQTMTLSFGNHTVHAVKDGISDEKIIFVNEHGENEWTLNLRETSREVTLKSDPLGAKLYVDNHYVGISPQTITLPIGEHTVLAVKDGETKLQSINVTKQGQNEWTLNVRNTSRVVLLRSEPSGASLYVDGHYEGITPQTTNLSFGVHTVRAEKDGVKKEQSIIVNEQGQSVWTLNVTNQADDTHRKKQHQSSKFPLKQRNICNDCHNIRREFYMGIGAGDMNGLSMCANTRIPLSFLIEIGFSPVHWGLDFEHGFVYYPSLTIFPDTYLFAAYTVYDYMPCFTGVSLSILYKPRITKNNTNGWFFLIGGGPRLGYMFFMEQRTKSPWAEKGGFTFGVCGLFGIEYKFAKPLTFQFDIRVLYMMSFSNDYHDYVYGVLTGIPSLTLKFRLE